MAEKNNAINTEALCIAMRAREYSTYCSNPYIAAMEFFREFNLLHELGLRDELVNLSQLFIQTWADKFPRGPNEAVSVWGFPIFNTHVDYD